MSLRCMLNQRQGSISIGRLIKGISSFSSSSYSSSSNVLGGNSCIEEFRSNTVDLGTEFEELDTPDRFRSNDFQERGLSSQKNSHFPVSRRVSGDSPTDTVLHYFRQLREYGTHRIVPTKVRAKSAILPERLRRRGFQKGPGRVGQRGLSLSKISDRHVQKDANETIIGSGISDHVEKPREPNAEHIGYRVVGKTDALEKPFHTPAKGVFAVVQVGSHQFKVCPGDAIYVEKLLFADVNDQLSLEKVLLLGSKWRTVIGRPTIPEASVLAALEEHALDEKVIVFKKKRRKNYRRTNGHRQELTRLRIIDIVGLDGEQIADGGGTDGTKEPALEAA